MPAREAPCVELGTAPETPSIVASPSPSEISSASSPEPQNVRATPLFRALAMLPPDPVQPPGQDELERRLPGYRRIVIPRDLTLIELLKQCSGVTTDEEVLRLREAKLRVIAENVGLRRLHILAPLLRSLILDGSAISSLRDLGVGLVHLKVLSVNRCGLTCLDGIWGLGVLRELYVAGNRLQELHPLGALQKLHTLDLSNNPISDTGRLWTLGVCSSLRRLTLRGTPAADSAQYRTRVASLLPMLVYLDDGPLHTDIEYGAAEGEFDVCSNSESDENEDKETNPLCESQEETREPQPGPSREWSSSRNFEESEQDSRHNNTVSKEFRRRPATAEGVGIRPARPIFPPRPHTAHARPTGDTSSRFFILNSLMDEEWSCSGSQLTSQAPVSGNLARALRRPNSSRCRDSIYAVQGDLQFVGQVVENASRSLASEIPRATRVEDWAEFRRKTGIDIEIDFDARPVGDPSRAIERLEQIERETQERLSKEKCTVTTVLTSDAGSSFDAASVNLQSSQSTSEDDLLKNIDDFLPSDT